MSEPLNVGGFTKTVNNNQVAFLGWNPYCPETGKWYYANSDASQRGWYIEGEEPIGFSKALYANAGTVSKTTKAGGHIVLFAVWDEFTIYYDANGQLIKPGHIKLPTVVHKGNLTDLDKYTASSVYVYDTTKYKDNGHIVPIALNGYHQYIVDTGRWRYYNDQDSSIWLPDSDLPLYTYTGNTISNGLNAGWHVVFSADWSYT